MPNPDLPILVVDDAKFSSIVVSRTLRNAGYRDIRIANNAREALAHTAERPASLLIADWLMPEMDGLTLADRIRQQDEQNNHYTYIILLTAKESVEALTEAFDRGVDDFIYKSDMSKQLIPRVFAAERLTGRHNSLLQRNSQLTENNRKLVASSLTDLKTGLYNRSFCRQRLARLLRHTEARSGATAYLLCGIRNWNTLKRRYPAAIMNELATGIGRRLGALIRPIDTLCRVGENLYVVLAWFPEAEHCSAHTYRRLLDGINHKAVKTSAGYIPVEAGVALCRAESGDHGTADVDTVEQAALQALKEAFETRRFTETRAEAAPREEAAGSAP